MYYRILHTISLIIFIVVCQKITAQGLVENFEGNALPASWGNEYQQAMGNPWIFANEKASVTNSASLLGAEQGPSWLISKDFIPQAGYGTLVFTLEFPASLPLGASKFQVLITQGSATNYGSYQVIHQIDRSVTSAGTAGTVRVKIPTNFWGQSCHLAFVQSVSGLLSSDQATIDRIRLESDPLYSVKSGATSDVIWSESFNGFADPVIFTANTSLVIQSGTSVTISDPIRLVNITIDPTASLKSTNTEVELIGSLINKGILDLRPAKLRFEGTFKQILDGDMFLKDFEISNTAGVEINSGNVKLCGNLEIMTGFLKTNNRLIVYSDENGTGSIDQLYPNAIQGSITIQRYVPAGQTDWRFLSSPLKGRTFAEWNEELITSGFPGSDKPSYPFITNYSYAENIPGPVDNGFKAATDIGNPLTPGIGYYVYCGDSAQGPGSFKLSMSGEVNQGDISQTLTYTSSSEPKSDGFNFLGNPYPSPIDFGQLSKNQVDDKYWVYDPLSGNMDSWGGKVEIGLMRTGGQIHSMQGFMVRSKSGGGTLIFKEEAKVKSADAIFLKAATNKRLISLKMKPQTGRYFDVAVVVIDSSAKKGIDESDVEKVNISHPDAPLIAMMDQQLLSINALPSIIYTDTIFLRLNARKSGNYVIQLDRIQGFDSVYCVLKNLGNGERYKVDGTLNHTLSLSRNVPDSNYVLLFEEKESFKSIPNRCYAGSEGVLIARGPGTGPWTYTWKDSTGVILRQSGSAFPDTLKGLKRGTYKLEVTSEDYPFTGKTLQVGEGKKLIMNALASDESCPQNNDGILQLKLVGGNGPLTVKWNTGDTALTLYNLKAAGYSASITDSAKCTYSIGPLVIKEPDSLRAIAKLQKDTAYFDELVSFQADANRPINDFHWNFGDGNTSTDEDASHRYSGLGTFTIELRVGNGYCEAFITDSIVVKINDVGIEDEGLENLFDIKVNRDGILQIIPRVDFDKVRVETLEGRLIAEATKLKAKELKELKIDIDSSGFYVVILMVGEKASSLKVWFN